MILQHNTQDSDQKIGNVIKITMWGLISAEERCFQLRNEEVGKQSAIKVSKAHTQDKIDWTCLIPSKVR